MRRWVGRTITCTRSVDCQTDCQSLPDGAEVYVSNGADNMVSVIDTTNDTVVTTLTGFASPTFVAIVPDQAPVASFTITPGAPGTTTSFDAEASSTMFGTITSYSWNFGDGSNVVTSSPTIAHVYAGAGHFAATLTVTDSSGTSTAQVFTGQTVVRNGGASATTSQSVTVAPPTATTTTTTTTSQPGYWEVGQDGGVFAFGSAGFFGSLPGSHIDPTAPMGHCGNH